MQENRKIEIAPNIGGYGSLRWYDTPEIDDSRAALLGRVAALYVWGTRTQEIYNLDVLQEPRKRGALLRTVTNWVESYSKKGPKRLLETFCFQSPGVNAQALEQEPFNSQLLQWWYKWTLSRLEALNNMLAVVRDLWPPMDMAAYEPLVALGLPRDIWNKLRRMERLPGLDLERCFNAGLEEIADNPDYQPRPFLDSKDDLKEFYERPEKRALQEAFVAAYKEEEARLLKIAPKARDKEFEEFGV